MKCKYCGEVSVRDDGRYTHFKCGSWCESDGDAQQSEFCKSKQDAEDLARYRAIFPVAPWSADPITPYVCERLGMHRTLVKSRVGSRTDNVQEYEWWEWRLPPILWEEDADSVWWKDLEFRGANAGVLSRLIAARKAST